MPTEITNDDVISLKTDIGIIKSEMNSIQTVYKSMESTLDKMTSIANDLNKLLLLQESRITLNESNLNHLNLKVDDKDLLHDKEIKLIQERIENTYKLNSDEREKNHKEVMARLKEMSRIQSVMEDRIMKLESWRWYVLGGFVVIGFIITRIPWAVTFMQ